MGNVWITADTHFGHKNIVRACSVWENKETACRDFPSVEEHDAFILNEINKYVKPSDTLRHLGDFGLGFAWKTRLPELRAKINCEDIRINFGNHDHLLENAFSYKKTEITSLFKWMGYLSFGKIGGYKMVLCHYAMRTWPWQGHGSYMCYGHSHGNLPDDPHSLSIDVGMDTDLFGHKKYTPYSVEEIDHIMKNYKGQIKILDHHGKHNEG